MTAKRVSIGLGTTAAALVLVASVAWACVAATVIPFVEPLTPRVAAPGTEVTATGGNWTPHGSIELRWATADGQLLAGTTVDEQGRFSATFRVPQVGPASYWIGVVQGAVMKSVLIEVPAPVATGGATNPGGGGTGADPSPTGPPVLSNRTSGGVGTTPAPAPAPAQPSQPAQPAVPDLGGAPGGGTGATGVPATDLDGPAPNPAPASVGEPASPAVVPAPPEAAPAEERSPSPSRVVSGDLWSGFAPGDGGAFRAPSLTDSAPAGSPLTPAEIGIGLFASGVVALFAGFAVAELARRRVPVVASPGSERSPLR